MKGAVKWYQQLHLYVWTYIIDVYESVKREVHDKIKPWILKIFVSLFFRDGEKIFHNTRFHLVHTHYV